jgi:hypothetical protein
MADLSELQAAQSIKIVGSDSAGAENNYVSATANGDMKAADISNNGGTQAALTVGVTAVEVKVGGSALTNRKSATLFNNSNNTIYWGYTNAVTTSTGTPIFKNQYVEWSVGSSTSIYVISASAGNDTRITENA